MALDPEPSVQQVTRGFTGVMQPGRGF